MKRDVHWTLRLVLFIFGFFFQGQIVTRVVVCHLERQRPFFLLQSLCF